MKYYALLSSGDKVKLTETEYATMLKFMQRSINKSLQLEDGDLIRSEAIIYLGIDTREESAAKKPEKNVKLDVDAIEKDLKKAEIPKEVPKKAEEKPKKAK